MALPKRRKSTTVTGNIGLALGRVAVGAMNNAITFGGKGPYHRNESLKEYTPTNLIKRAADNFGLGAFKNIFDTAKPSSNAASSNNSSSNSSPSVSVRALNRSIINLTNMVRVTANQQINLMKGILSAQLQTLSALGSLSRIIAASANQTGTGPQRGRSGNNQAGPTPRPARARQQPQIQPQAAPVPNYFSANQNGARRRSGQVPFNIPPSNQLNLIRNTAVPLTSVNNNNSPIAARPNIAGYRNVLSNIVSHTPPTAMNENLGTVRTAPDMSHYRLMRMTSVAPSPSNNDNIVPTKRDARGRFTKRVAPTASVSPIDVTTDNAEDHKTNLVDKNSLANDDPALPGEGLLKLNPLEGVTKLMSLAKTSATEGILSQLGKMAASLAEVVLPIVSDIAALASPLLLKGDTPSNIPKSPNAPTPITPDQAQKEVDKQNSDLDKKYGPGIFNHVYHGIFGGTGNPTPSTPEPNRSQSLGDNSVKSDAAKQSPPTIVVTPPANPPLPSLGTNSPRTKPYGGTLGNGVYTTPADRKTYTM